MRLIRFPFLTHCVIQAAKINSPPTPPMSMSPLIHIYICFSDQIYTLCPCLDLIIQRREEVQPF